MKSSFNLITTVLVIAACGYATSTSSDTPWLAELAQSHQIIRMGFSFTGTTLTGTAELYALTDPAHEQLSIIGNRVADTLAITFQRAGVASFSFHGWYVGSSKLAGVLDGAEFSQVSARFTKH